MPEIVIYSTQVCSYCVKAKQLLSTKGAAFKEIDISRDPALVAESQNRSGGRKTVPQIFIGELHVGGCDVLYALDAAGKLDELLK